MKRKWFESHQEGAYSSRVLGGILPALHRLVLQAAQLKFYEEGVPLGGQGERPGQEKGSLSTQGVMMAFLFLNSIQKCFV